MNDDPTRPLFELLHRLHVPYERCDHPAVYTTEEASRLVPPLPGAKAKNLFVRDAKSPRRFLVVVPYEKRVDLRGLAESMGLRKLSFASADELMETLGITAGAVSLLALVNDTQHQAELIVDRAIWAADAIQCHPLVNTATLSIGREGLQRLLEATGHPPCVIDVPERAETV